MRLVIDMQPAQSEFSSKRGVGRYTFELTKNLILCSSDKIEILLALNGRLNCTKILEYFDGIIDRKCIKVWNYYPEALPASEWNQSTTHPIELFREWFFHQFNADAIWIPNYQEGYVESNIATSTNITQGSEYIVSTLHDVTPLLYENEFLQGNIKNWYRKKIQYVKDSDIILTDSEFSKAKIHDLIGIDLRKIKVIKCAYDPQKFYADSNYIRAEKKEKFFLYSGGADKHKNLDTLIQAYGNLKEDLRNQYHLKLVGSGPNQSKDYLIKIAGSYGVREEQIEFLGYIPDDELRVLMQRCTGFIFPAYAEGFGLPPLEAAACGAPTIVADATSLREVIIDKNARFNPFDINKITELMNRLVFDKDYSNYLIQNELKQENDFSWKKSGEQLRDILLELPKHSNESLYSKKNLCEDLKKTLDPHDYAYKARVAKSIEHSVILNNVKHIYVDTSALVLESYVSGIQRVVNGIITNLHTIFDCRKDVIVEAIYSDTSYDCFYKARYDGTRLVRETHLTQNDVVDFYDGDLFIMPDLHPANIISKRRYLKALCMRGIKVVSILYDIIPMEHPNYFQQNFVEQFEKYLRCIAEFSGVVSISKTTMNLFSNWCKDNGIISPPFFNMDYNYLGCDIEQANPTKGYPEGGEAILSKIVSAPTILMVGTLEPRKKHNQVFDAMDELWKTGADYNLVFVGRNGWKMDGFIEKIETHAEKDKHFFWLSGITDEFLEKVYEASSGVMIASIQEGYGLPIIEGSQHGKPLLIRDIPVFREIAGENAEYFTAEDAHELAKVIDIWLKKISKGEEKNSAEIPCFTWRKSTLNLIKKIAPDFLSY